MNCSAQMATPFESSFNIIYIYPVFILLFHKGLHHPFLFLSLSVHLSLFLSIVPRPVFLISGLSLRFGDVDVFLLQSKVLCILCLQLTVRHIHYPVNPSSDHFHADAVVQKCQVDQVNFLESLSSRLVIVITTWWRQ